MTRRRLTLAMATALGAAAIGNLPMVSTATYATNTCGNGSVRLWDQGGWVGVTKSFAGAVADDRTVATEIQIAVADAKCRLTMDWGREWLNTVSSYEQAILEQYPDMLPAYREARAALLRKSAAVVAANS